MYESNNLDNQEAFHQLDLLVSDNILTGLVLYDMQKSEKCTRPDEEGQK